MQAKRLGLSQMARTQPNGWESAKWLEPSQIAGTEPNGWEPALSHASSCSSRVTCSSDSPTFAFFCATCTKHSRVAYIFNLSFTGLPSWYVFVWPFRLCLLSNHTGHQPYLTANSYCHVPILTLKAPLILTNIDSVPKTNFIKVFCLTNQPWKRRVKESQISWETVIRSFF